MGGGTRFSGPVKPHTAVRHAFGTRAVSSVSGSGQEGGAAGVGGAPPPKRSTLCQVLFDGGSRGNPGPGGFGFVILAEDGSVVHKECGFMGRCTNNEAEYQGCLRGLQAARAYGFTHVEALGDSKLVLNQLEGTWKIEAANLKAQHGECLAAARSFQQICYRHIPRELNKMADQLANVAMDTRQDTVVYSAPDLAPRGKPATEG